VRRVQQQLAAAGLHRPPSPSRSRNRAACATSARRGPAGELAAMGIELWLDDFGTGHSSLEWLSHLPTHGLKIPGTFVERLLATALPGDREACDRAGPRPRPARRGRGGGDRGAARPSWPQSGCDLFQGFLFYAPMPAEELAAALAGAVAPSPKEPP
jgi:predicted signal transduction protein with EAL and GGDEF domain